MNFVINHQLVRKLLKDGDLKRKEKMNNQSNSKPTTTTIFFAALSEVIEQRGMPDYTWTLDGSNHLNYLLSDKAEDIFKSLREFPPNKEYAIIEAEISITDLVQAYSACLNGNSCRGNVAKVKNIMWIKREPASPTQ